MAREMANFRMETTWTAAGSGCVEQSGTGAAVTFIQNGAPHVLHAETVVCALPSPVLSAIERIADGSRHPRICWDHHTLLAGAR